MSQPIFAALNEPDGTELWLESDINRSTKTEQSAPIRCDPGKVEKPTSMFSGYEIAGASVVKEAYLDVWNDVEGTHYRVGAPLNVGQHTEQGPWFSVTIHHEYLQGKRVFRYSLRNWSHTWGRWMQLNLTYEQGTRTTAPR